MRRPLVRRLLFPLIFCSLLNCDQEEERANVLARRFEIEARDVVGTPPDAGGLFAWRLMREPRNGLRSVVDEGSRHAPRYPNWEDGDIVTWFGHSTVWLKLGGTKILFDPVFNGDFHPLGRRGHEMPYLTDSYIPAVDLVLISHNHYDHLSVESVQRLLDVYTNMNVVVPLGDKRLLPHRYSERITEISWFDTIEVAGIHVSFVPTKHWSRRNQFDLNRSLWGGYIVQDKLRKKTAYLIGDSAYSPILERNLNGIGGIDLLVVPIGCYTPRNLLDDVHMNIDQAITLEQKIRPGLAIGVHWGATDNCDDSLLDYEQAIAGAKEKTGKNSLALPAFGWRYAW